MRIAWFVAQLVATWWTDHVTVYRTADGCWRFGIGYAMDGKGFALVAGRRGIAFHRSLAVDPDPVVTRI